MPRTLITFLLLAIACRVLAQAALEGTVRGEDGEALPYANLFFPDLQTGTATDDDGAFYFRFPSAGEYRVAVSALGYQTSDDTLVIGDATVRNDFTLYTSAAELNEIVVSASKRDPAYAIIRNASERRKDRLTDISSYKVEVYLKAREDIESFETPREKRRRERREAKGKDPDPAPAVSVSTAGDEGGIPDGMLAEEPPALDSATTTGVSSVKMKGLHSISRRVSRAIGASRSASAPLVAHKTEREIDSPSAAYFFSWR